MAGKLIVHGVNQAILGTVNVLIDGNKVASVKIKDSVSIPIVNNCTMSIQCGVNPSKPSMQISDGMISEVQCIYSRLSSKFSLELISQTPYTINDAVEDNVAKPIYDIQGVRGRSIRVYEDKCVITTKITVGSILTHNASDGEKTIYYMDCIGVQFKKAGLEIGYMQLETASSTMNNRANNFFNENSFTFDTNTVTNEKMEEVTNYIRKQIEQAKKATNTPISVAAALSPADELKKFKELLDLEIITQEEFDAKKKQLLGL